MVTHSLYCLVDVFFVGVAGGSDGLAALNVALPIFTVYTAFSVMIGVGAATTISVCTGAGEGENTHRIFSLAMVLVVGIGVVIATVGTLNLRTIAYLFGATDRIVDGVVAYLAPINLLAFVYMLSSSLSIVVRSDGNPKLVMMAGTIGNLCNIALDYVFVIRMGWGIFGAGLATIIGPCVSLGILSMHFFHHHNRVHFVKDFWKTSLLRRVLQNGVGSSILELSAGFIILMFNIVLIRVSGESAVALFSIISNVAYVGKGIYNGMAQAAQPLISLNYGAGRYRVVREANNSAMKVALCFSILVYGLLLLFPGQIISFFVSSDPGMVEMGTRALWLYFLSFPFTGLNTILMYYFQSLERPLYTGVIAILRGVVLIYISLMTLSALWGEAGVWISLFVAEALTFLFFFPIKLRFERHLLREAPLSLAKAK